MSKDMNELVGKLTDFLKQEAKTETVIGKEFKLGEFTCVPVMRMGMGLGYGGGEGRDEKKGGEGSGGGAGFGMDPIGFLVTKGGEISFVPAQRSSTGLSKAFERLPDLLEKFADKKTAAN
ncbi:MAG: GerW family sporulation protein [Flavobacteriales bacterium]|nr:GerW family sporulation protein [Flavobacteriales bacterium]